MIDNLLDGFNDEMEKVAVSNLWLQNRASKALSRRLNKMKVENPNLFKSLINRFSKNSPQTIEHIKKYPKDNKAKLFRDMSTEGKNITRSGFREMNNLTKKYKNKNKYKLIGIPKENPDNFRFRG